MNILILCCILFLYSLSFVRRVDMVTWGDFLHVLIYNYLLVIHFFFGMDKVLLSLYLRRRY